MINRIPLGFLGMLGSQTQGKNPFEASEVVAPTIEMTPFYHAQAIRTAFVQLNNAAVNNAAQITVPANKAWMLYSANVRAVAAANNDFIDVHLETNKLNGGGIAYLKKFVKTTGLTAADRMIATTDFTNLFPVLAGTELIFRVDSTNNAILVNCFLYYAEFDA